MPFSIGFESTFNDPRRASIRTTIEAGIDAFVASTRINRYELGIHKPDLLTVRKLAQVLKVPMAFFYADTDDEIAELLFQYGKAGEEVRLKIQTLLANQPSQST